MRSYLLAEVLSYERDIGAYRAGDVRDPEPHVSGHKRSARAYSVTDCRRAGQADAKAASAPSCRPRESEPQSQTAGPRLLRQAPTLPGPPQDLKRTSRVAEQFFVAPTAWVRPAAGCVKLASWDEATPHITFSGGPPIFPYPCCGRSYSPMRLCNSRPLLSVLRVPYRLTRMAASSIRPTTHVGFAPGEPLMVAV